MLSEAAILWTGQGFAALYGVVLGSFWNVAISRLPDDLSLWPRSACPRCGAAIAAHDNIPLLSWLWLRGGCRHCGGPISLRYPLIELLGALLGWWLFRALIPTLGQLDVPHLAAWVVQFGLLSLLVVGSMVDIRHRILPDQVTIYAAPFGILGAFVLGWLGYDGWIHPSVSEAVLGACVWPLVFWLGAFIGRLWAGMDVLGWGDVKLVALLGAFLGPLGAFVAIMVGSILGSIFGIVAQLVMRRRLMLPFGPPLSVGAVWFVFFGESFVDLMFPMWGL